MSKSNKIWVIFMTIMGVVVIGCSLHNIQIGFGIAILLFTLYSVIEAYSSK